MSNEAKQIISMQIIPKHCHCGTFYLSFFFFIQKFQNAFISFAKTGMKRNYTCDLAEELEFSDVLLVCHARFGEKSYF